MINNLVIVKRQHIIFFILFVHCQSFTAGLVVAQNQIHRERSRTIDSLDNLLVTSEENAAKVNILNDLCWQYKNMNPKKALEYINQAYTLANEIHDSLGIAKSVNRIGVINRDLGNYEEAISLHLESVKLYEELDDKSGIASSSLNLGVVYYYLKNLEKALEYFKRSLQINEEIGDKRSIAASMNNVGAVYKAQEQIDDALEYYTRALEIREDINDKEGISECLNNIGILHEENGEYKNAIECYKKSLQIDVELDKAIGIGICLYNIAMLYSKQGNKPTAIEYLDSSLAIANTIQADNIIRTIYRSYSEIYSDLRDFEKAHKYLRLSALLSDSLFDAESTKQIADMQTKYETEKKEKEIALLTKDNEIKDLAVSRQKLLRNSFVGGLVLALAMAFLLYNRYRLKQKANALLEQKNKYITDSIDYAKTIQQAMLVKEDEIRKYLNDFFIFFRPKDIVSGDFYWFAEKNGAVLMAAVDCTGHGVPGAFMSMMGNTLLNEIVNEKGITTPSEILKHLHQNVITSLHQDQEDSMSRDGMDMALCKFDRETLELQYAGAHNPMYLVRNGELIETKGAKCSIGDRRFGGEYTNHTMRLVKGDCLYLFSDGLVDQRGGPKRKKFYYRPFQELLVEHSQKPMEEQWRCLDKVVAEWMRDEKQIDDILVVGVRV